MLGVFQGSRKGKARRSTTSYTSPYADPTKEPSPLEGVGECSLIFFVKRKKPWNNGAIKKEKLRGWRTEKKGQRKKQEGRR